MADTNGQKYYIGAIVTLAITLISGAIYAGGLITRVNDAERRLGNVESSMTVIQSTMVTKQDLKDTKEELKYSIENTHFTSTNRGR